MNRCFKGAHRAPLLGKTLAGNPCKKCITKGEPCHLHWTVRTVPALPPVISTLVKTTSVVNWSGDINMMPWLDVIPTTALYTVLLHLEPNTLNFICQVCRRAFTVSLLPRFREDYLKKHKLRNLIQGSLKLHSEMRRRGPYGGSYGKVFVDDSNNKIWIFWEYHDIRKIIYKHHKSEVGIEWNVGIGYFLMKKMMWGRISEMGGIDYLRTTTEEMTAFLFEISRPNWYPGYTGQFKNKNQERRVIAEFLAQLEPCILRVFPEFRIKKGRKGRGVFF